MPSLETSSKLSTQGKVQVTGKIQNNVPINVKEVSGDSEAVLSAESADIYSVVLPSCSLISYLDPSLRRQSRVMLKQDEDHYSTKNSNETDCNWVECAGQIAALLNDFEECK